MGGRGKWLHFLGGPILEAADKALWPGNAKSCQVPMMQMSPNVI